MIFTTSLPAIKPPTKAAQKKVYDNFMRTGASGTHSTLGHTLAPLLNRLTKEGVAFSLTFEPGGYYLTKSSSG